MQHTAIRFAALAAASAVLAACTASGNLNVTPMGPGASGAPSTMPSGTGSTAPSAAPTTKPSAAPSAAASAGTSALGNDSFDKAYKVTIGTPITGEIAKGEKEMFYRIDVPAGAQDGWLSFELDEANDDYGAKIAWYNGNKVDMGKDTFASGTEHPKSGSIRAKAGSTYYVTIPPYANDETITYNAKVTWSAVEDKNERNDSFATATAAELDKAITFSTFWADDQEEKDHDFFKVTIPAGKTKLRAKLTNKNTDEGDGGYQLKLYSGNKVDLGDLYTDSDLADLDKVWGGDDLAAGDYYVDVTGGNGGVLSELTLSAE